ncbi:hypothetical protein FOZ63_030696, partial [Perkinsus olseni]
GFSYGFEWPKTHRAFANKLQGPNVWPVEIPAEDQHTLVKLDLLAHYPGQHLCDQGRMLSPRTVDQMKEMIDQAGRLSEVRLTRIGGLSQLCCSKKELMGYRQVTLREVLVEVMPAKEAPERISLVHFYYPNYNTTFAGLLDSDAAKRTSLVADQKEGGASAWIEDDGHIMAFGDFIAAKWSQVHRPVSRTDEEL